MPAKAADVRLGSLVYVKGDGDKTKPRERYMVTKVEGNMCTILKLQKEKFQKKEYHLKLTEVFPVTPTDKVLDNGDKGFDSSDDETVEVVERAPLSSPHQSLAVPSLDRHEPVSNDVEAGERSCSPPLEVVGVDVGDVVGDESDEKEEDTTMVQPSALPTRASTRSRKRPSHLDDFVLG